MTKEKCWLDTYISQGYHNLVTDSKAPVLRSSSRKNLAVTVQKQGMQRPSCSSFVRRKREYTKKTYPSQSQFHRQGSSASMWEPYGSESVHSVTSGGCPNFSYLRPTSKSPQPSWPCAFPPQAKQFPASIVGVVSAECGINCNTQTWIRGVWSATAQAVLQPLNTISGLSIVHTEQTPRQR